MRPISDCVFFDYSIVYMDEIHSTNDYLKSYVSEKNLNHPLAVFSEYQNSGRGQRSRAWESNRGENMLVSFYVPVQWNTDDMERFFMLSILAIVSAIEAADSSIQNTIHIKWPNDIYLHDKKIGGILIENSLKGHQVHQVFIGLGLNVHQRSFSINLPQASSLAIEYPTILWDRTKILNELICRLEQVFLNIKSTHYPDIVSMYNQRLYQKNKTLTIPHKGEYTILGINAHGHLVVENILSNDRIALTSSTDIQWNF